MKQPTKKDFTTYWVYDKGTVIYQGKEHPLNTKDKRDYEGKSMDTFFDEEAYMCAMLQYKKAKDDNLTIKLRQAFTTQLNFKSEKDVPDNWIKVARLILKCDKSNLNDVADLVIEIRKLYAT